VISAPGGKKRCKKEKKEGDFHVPEHGLAAIQSLLATRNIWFNRLGWECSKAPFALQAGDVKRTFKFGC